MSGQDESPAETTKQRLASFEKVLDEYKGKLGIGQITYNPIEVQECLDLSYEQLSKLTEEDCGIKAYILNRFAAYLNQENNRHQSRIEWANSNLLRLLAQTGSQYGDSYVKHEVKLAALCAGNTTAETLNQILLHAKARAHELNDVAKHISMISRDLNNLRQSKRKHYDPT
jgi:hypothetical protein